MNVDDCVEVKSGEPDGCGRCGTIIKKNELLGYKVQLLGHNGKLFKAKQIPCDDGELDKRMQDVFMNTGYLRESEVRKIDKTEMERSQAEERAKALQWLNDALARGLTLLDGELLDPADAFSG